MIEMKVVVLITLGCVISMAVLSKFTLYSLESSNIRDRSKKGWISGNSWQDVASC